MRSLRGRAAPERIRSIKDLDLLQHGQTPDCGPACGRVPAESCPKPESPSPGLCLAMKGDKEDGKVEGAGVGGAKGRAVRENDVFVPLNIFMEMHMTYNDVKMLGV